MQERLMIERSMMDRMIEAAARALYEAERARGESCNAVLSAVAGKPITDAVMEPWEECAEIFRGDARAALKAATTIPGFRLVPLYTTPPRPDASPQSDAEPERRPVSVLHHFRKPQND